MFRNALFALAAMAAAASIATETAHGQTWVTTGAYPSVVTTNYGAAPSPAFAAAPYGAPSRCPNGYCGPNCPACGPDCQCGPGCSCAAGCSCGPGCQCGPGGCTCRQCPPGCQCPTCVGGGFGAAYAPGSCVGGRCPNRGGAWHGPGACPNGNCQGTASGSFGPPGFVAKQPWPRPAGPSRVVVQPSTRPLILSASSATGTAASF